MGLRFHKKIKLLPGLHLNISKQGISLSGGINGATVNLGKGGLTGTVSAPGSGLSYRQRLIEKIPTWVLIAVFTVAGLAGLIYYLHK